MDPIDVGDSLVQENPLQLQYMKKLRIYLLSIGSWPDEQFGRKLPLLIRIQRISLPGQVFMILLGTFYYLIQNYHRVTFFVVGHVLISSFLCIIMIVRVVLPNFEEYGLVIKDFMDFHLIHYKHKGKHYKEIYTMTEKVSHYFALYQVSMMYCGMTLFCATPLYNNYGLGVFRNPRPENQSFDYAVFIAYPGYSQDDHFYLSNLITAYCSYNCSVTLCIMDLLLCLMVFQIIGHIKTLMVDMETLPGPKVIIDVTNEFPAVKVKEAKATVEKFDPDENQIIHIKLTKMIHHHRLIVGFADRVSTFFGPMLALNYLFHLVSGCILLLECSSKETKELARFGPLTVVVFGQLIQLSSVFEFVGYMSEKLIDSVYYMPWECMDIRNQRSVRFLLNRIQTPIQLTAMGIVPVGVQTMQAILKSTLSFFAFLQTLSE